MILRVRIVDTPVLSRSPFNEGLIAHPLGVLSHSEIAPDSVNHPTWGTPFPSD